MTTIEAQHLTVNAEATLPSCGCPARRYVGGFIEGFVALAVTHECSAKRAANPKTIAQFVVPDYPVLCDPLAAALAQAF